MVDFLYGRVVDAGADVVDAVDPRCYNGNRYPPVGTRWRQSTHCLNTVSTNTHRPSDEIYQSLAAPLCAALKSFVGNLWRPLHQCQKPQ